MKTRMITGGGGIQLNVVESGSPTGRPIVFLHGISQSWLTWQRQLNSDLAENHRLVAVDLRGHGLSDKPREGYADSRLWADDVRTVIRNLELDHPVLCGWSYGPLVILDYIRHYGEDEIGGVNFIGGVTKLGGDDATAVLSAEFLELVPGFFSSNVEESVSSLGALLRLCFAEKLSPESFYQMLGAGVSAPPYVRQGLFSRTFHNDDLLPRLRKPVLVTHGTKDAVVKTAVIERQFARIGSMRLQMMATGHGCFWDDAPGYNRCLREFAASL